MNANTNNKYKYTATDLYWNAHNPLSTANTNRNTNTSKNTNENTS